jgi:hypothetical protein
VALVACLPDAVVVVVSAKNRVESSRVELSCEKKVMAKSLDATSLREQATFSAHRIGSVDWNLLVYFIHRKFYQFGQAQVIALQWHMWFGGAPGFAPRWANWGG